MSPDCRLDLRLSYRGRGTVGTLSELHGMGIRTIVAFQIPLITGVRYLTCTLPRRVHPSAGQGVRRDVFRGPSTSHHAPDCRLNLRLSVPEERTGIYLFLLYGLKYEHVFIEALQIFFRGRGWIRFYFSSSSFHSSRAAFLVKFLFPPAISITTPSARYLCNQTLIMKQRQIICIILYITARGSRPNVGA